MGVHNNIHIPSESWPNWTWYAIEFFIVLAVSLIISWKLTDAILPQIADAVGHGGALGSWEGISIHSIEFKELSADIKNKIVSISNWTFYAIMGAIFLGWYIPVRRVVLKKRTLN